MRDTIIVDQYNGNHLSPGTRFFCGCCGEILAVLEKPISFPFDHIKWMKHCKDITFTSGGIFKGLRHTTCGHLMFPMQPNWGFSKIEWYFQWQKEDAKKKKPISYGAGDN